MDLESFKPLLVSLQSTDHDVRTKAETTLAGIPASNRLSLFLQSMSDATLSPECRTLAAVLCRPLLMNDFDEAFQHLPENAKKELKNELLLAIKREPVELMRRKIADVVAELVREHFGNFDFKMICLPLPTSEEPPSLQL